MISREVSKYSVDLSHTGETRPECKTNGTSPMCLPLVLPENKILTSVAGPLKFKFILKLSQLQTLEAHKINFNPFKMHVRKQAETLHFSHVKGRQAEL